MISLNTLNVNQFKALTGIHFTIKMNGKMEGMQSLSTSCNVNPFCVQRMKEKKSICSHCFAHAQMNCFKSMNKPLEKNAELLTSDIIPVENMPILNCLFFRFEAFGDLINYKQVVNYFNICEKNPLVKCALWTKNPWIIQEAIEKGYVKPENLQIIFSSCNINQAVNEAIKEKWSFIDKIFTVYDASGAENVNINCGVKKCLTCGLCYNKNNVTYINERLK